MTRPLTSAALAAVLIAAASSAAIAQNVVKLGEIEAQTGPASIFGLMPSQGLRRAVDEINKAGGFVVAGKTYTFTLDSADTQGNPQTALVQTKKMLGEDGVK